VALPIRCCGAQHKPQRHRGRAGTPNMRKERSGRTDRRCAPATPRRRERPGHGNSRLSVEGFFGQGSCRIPSVSPWRRDQPGHGSFGGVKDCARRYGKCGKFPQALPAVRSELRPSVIVVPVWSATSLSRRMYDGFCAFPARLATLRSGIANDFARGAAPPKPTPSGLFLEGKGVNNRTPKRNGERPGGGSGECRTGALVRCPPGRCIHTLLPPRASKQPAHRGRAT
jgi:hypothetical protein